MSDPLFSIDVDVYDITMRGIDTLILVMGKNLQLVFPPRAVPCSNCVWNPQAGRSANIWIDGGPMPFRNGTKCPMCDGAGKKMLETTQTIKGLVVLDPKEWRKGLPSIIQVPEADMMFKTYLTYKPSIKKATKAVLQPEISAYGEQEFTLMSDPTDISNIVQGRYCVSFWKRSR